VKFHWMFHLYSIIICKFFTFRADILTFYYVLQGDLKRAEERFQDCIRIDPEHIICQLRSLLTPTPPHCNALS